MAGTPRPWRRSRPAAVVVAAAALTLIGYGDGAGATARAPGAGLRRDPRIPTPSAGRTLTGFAAEAARVRADTTSLDPRAYPRDSVADAQVSAAAASVSRVSSTGAVGSVRAAVAAPLWRELGPNGGEQLAGFPPGPYNQSGRANNLAVAPGCSVGRCTAYLTSAAGGVWRSDNALVPKPSWRPVTERLPRSRSAPSNWTRTTRGSSTWAPERPAGRRSSPRPANGAGGGAVAAWPGLTSFRVRALIDESLPGLGILIG